jgi:GMP synthase-like glutamine amidotransferase
MSKIFKYRDWKKRKIAVIHMPGSTDELSSAFLMLDLPHIVYEGDDPDLLEKFYSDSESICGISISGGNGKEISPVFSRLSEFILRFPVPKLGICLGNEILGEYLGSKLVDCNPPVGEYGEVIAKLSPNPLFEGLDLSQKYPVRMYHHQMLESPPKGSDLIASTRLTPVAGFYHEMSQTWGLQFHPEKDWMNTLIIENFYNFCLSTISGF